MHALSNGNLTNRTTLADKLRCSINEITLMHRQCHFGEVKSSSCSSTPQLEKNRFAFLSPLWEGGLMGNVWCSSHSGFA